MNKLNFSSSPIFGLKGINPSSILADIYAGKYSARPVFSLGGRKKLDPLSDTAVSTSNQNSRCMYVFSDGTEGYETVTTGIDTFDGSVVTGLCIYCMRYRMLPFGVCTRVEVTPLGLRYLVEDVRMCRPECSIARIYEMDLPEREKDVYIKNTQDMLRAKTGETKQFRRARDFRHLIEHGGCMTDEEWSDGNNTYTLLHNVLILPIKREYVVGKIEQ